MTNERLTLLDIEAADLPLLFEHQRDPRAVAMAAFRSRDRSAFHEHWAKLLADETVLKKKIVIDGELAGSVLSFIRDGKREVGYWIDRRFWGRGIATRALREFLKIDRSRPLHAVIAEHNAGSLRVAQRCGFTLPPGESSTGADPGGAPVLLTLTLHAEQGL